MGIREYLKENRLLCDGAFGTYYALLTDTNRLPELANTEQPELVERIHGAYLAAGARLLRTNTFASNKETLDVTDEELVRNIRAGYRCAVRALGQASEMRRKETNTQSQPEKVARACEGTPARAQLSARTCQGSAAYEDLYIAADIGPIPAGPETDAEGIEAQYRLICDTFLSEGAEIFLFETFPDLESLEPVIRGIKETNKAAFVTVQFCVNQHGYSNAGISAGHLLREAALSKDIDAVGFNCGVGPGHLQAMMEKLSLPEGKFLTAFPNAGYPQYIRNRMVFRDNAEYFAGRMRRIARLGVDILGGCCGTTPEYIRRTAQTVETKQTAEAVRIRVKQPSSLRPKKDSSFFGKKERENTEPKKRLEKLIAVELTPPPGANDEKLMEAAFYLKNKGVDAVTFPDSPSGRTRADSVLVGLKAGLKTGLCVMPHICCRDKNAIGIRSQLLGAYINGIRNLLVVTGDPVPTLIRQEVKSVFNFDSIGLMKIINELNQEEFYEDPLVFGGALNHNRPNLSVEIERMKRKIRQGASFFLTQPVFTEKDAQRLRTIRKETNARILCGIMPLVSLKNALFMQNEMAGIHVTEEIIAGFHPEMSREEGEAAGEALARRIIGFTEDFADGYYFSIPFNRVYMLEKIIF